ncbi:MAG TPA: LLM class flavin-dependent oxidoreductase [Acidimicrobiia bacterium]|jgi:limonene 1,2-monooxygenase|nr:LLM class flavin-dependent oxidoreductase [Acidimicrobiia bacterium]
MKFGLFLMPEPFPWSNWTLSYDLKLEEIVYAERFGYDEVWVGEHHTGAYENIPAPDIFVAKASALTSRIGLGTGTINLPYHDPFMVAERMAFLDHLTHGRLIYGFGGGGLVSDKLFFQVGDEASPRMREALDIIELLFSTTDHVDFDGKFWQLDHKRIQVRPYQEHPQFSIAGMSGTHNFELCGERGYAALSIYFTPVQIEDNPGMPDLIAQGNAIVKAAEAAGRDPVAARNDWRICREVYVADSKNAAMEEIRESLKQSYDYLFKIGLAPLMKRDASMADADVTFDWMVENVPWIIGSPEDVIGQVRELEEAVGGFGSLLFNSREWVTIDRWNRSLELFARYVSPHFRARDDQRFRAELAADALGD